MTQWVYRFGNGKAEGNARMRNELGGKGANLAEMSALGLPVPPGFTINTEVCTWFYKNGKSYPDGLEKQVADSLKAIETSVGRTFGDSVDLLADFGKGLLLFVIALAPWLPVIAVTVIPGWLLLRRLARRLAAWRRPVEAMPASE